MDDSALATYLLTRDFPVVEKKKKSYLTYEGLQDSYVYILKSGIIKMSVITRYGREFNLEYLQGLEIVSLLKDEYSHFIDSPFNIRIESDVAELYKVERVQFWRDVNKSHALQKYVNDYYRMRLLRAMKRMQQMLMNGKIGAVCTQLYELYENFGTELPDGTTKINLVVTNEEIARFCGISQASSVNRMMAQLRKSGAIEIVDRHLVIKNIDLIKENVIV